MANLFSEKPIVKVVMLKGQDGEEKLINQADGSGLSFWVGTKAEYEAIPEEELITDCVYYLTDDTAEDFNTRLNELDTKVDNNTTAIADINATLDEQLELNKVIYGNTGDEPIDSGGTFTAADEIISKYKMFAVIVGYTGNIKSLIVYPEFTSSFIAFWQLYVIEPSPDLADTLRSVGISIQIERTADANTYEFTGYLEKLNLTSRDRTTENIRLLKFIGIC